MKFTNNKPLYYQIADHFYEQILQQHWVPGSRIPSVREVASEMEVNPNTAIRAYELLQHQGVIFNKRGMGYYVAEDGYDKAVSIKREDFTKVVLPQVFKHMQVLAISLEEVEELYQQYQNNGSYEKE